MCKYEMDPMSIFEDTERIDSVHRRTDGQTDKVIPVYPPFNFVEAGGYNDETEKLIKFFDKSKHNVCCLCTY